MGCGFNMKLIVFVDAGLREDEGYTYRCRADYANDGQYVNGEEVEIANRGTGFSGIKIFVIVFVSVAA